MNGDNLPLADIALAYDRIAAEYDQQMQSSQWMRSVLWDAYRRLFRPGQRVLDLSCGTGIDALFLAGMGLRVVGIDISPGMVRQLEDKAGRLGLTDRIEVYVRDLCDLQAWAFLPFDGIVSGFAGLSTLPDLTGLAERTAHLLKPEGYLVVHMLNRFCFWTWLDQVRHGGWKKARHVGSQERTTVNIGGVSVRHYLYYPEEAYRRFFRRDLHLRRAYSLGSLRPPNAPKWMPAFLLKKLGDLERPLSGIHPFVNWGLFFVLEMQKRNGLL
jgi:SAM-dependent methyltransferase